jgi:energy-coupling factor transporter ATP-binding protein EcfA2
MITFSDVTFAYTDEDQPTLRRVNLSIDEGELCLVIGQTGSGKTTLLRAINGLVPHFTGGHLSGEVTVAGRSTREFPPRELADVVGVVGQNPAASFVTDTVEDELAYTMENLAIAPTVMRRRVEDALDLLGLHELRDRPLSTLSGGQQQRVAICAVLTAGAGARRAHLCSRPGRGRRGALLAYPSRPRRGHDGGPGRAPARTGHPFRRPGGPGARPG